MDPILSYVDSFLKLFWFVLALFGLVPGFLRDPTGFIGILWIPRIPLRDIRGPYKAQRGRKGLMRP